MSAAAPPSLELFDTHAHLCDEQFAGNVDEVVARAAAAGVRRILTVATNLTTSQACRQIAERFPGIWASAGIHPNYTSQAALGDWDEIVRLSAESRVVALGETGLDRYWDDAPFELQQDYFQRHLELSRQTELPVIVHLRECEKEMLEALRAARQLGPLRGIMHSFTGSAAAAEECVELGMYVSFAGMVTYKKSDLLRSIAAQVPADRLLIETDSPYLSPHPVRSQRPNEPALITHTAACLAELRGISVAELARQTTENACRLLRVA